MLERESVFPASSVPRSGIAGVYSVLQRFGGVLPMARIAMADFLEALVATESVFSVTDFVLAAKVCLEFRR